MTTTTLRRPAQGLSGTPAQGVTAAKEGDAQVITITDPALLSRLREVADAVGSNPQQLVEHWIAWALGE